MTALEIKILEGLKRNSEILARHDAKCKERHDSIMAAAEQATDEEIKRNKAALAKDELRFQNHGYDFVTEWYNIISGAMYDGRLYSAWHSAQPGRHGKGHDSYTTTEITDAEADAVVKVFNNLVRHGYLKVSKSGKMARFTK